MRSLSKQQASVINGTPEKRLFLSIISDYDLQTGLCELVDNAIDFWCARDRRSGFQVSIELDAERQFIVVEDNAGGVKASDLRLLVAPGASGNKIGDQLIGVFGVGGKRAGVALGELVEIRTRHKREASVQIDIDSQWLEADDWNLAAYEIQPIAPGTTTVSISKLRQRFDDSDVENIRSHLRETYAYFLNQGCAISLNDHPIEPIFFDAWAYPPGFEPRNTTFSLEPAVGEEISVQITAGLITDRDAERENYGVYFYCNDRLIIKELRTRDVGYFVTGEAGVPHPDASLCRVIVQLKGPARVMPWNSSKSGLNFNHPSFVQLRSRLIEFVSYFSSLSRRTKNNWSAEVFPYATGTIERMDANEIYSKGRMVLPKLPRVRRLAWIDEMKEKNAKTLQEKPWTLGILEALGIVQVITKQNLETKNRAALILLDSNFEIGLKEFIVSRTDLYPPQQYNDAKIGEIFKARHKVINEVKPHVALSQPLLNKINYYYGLRNKLVHERATVGIADSQIDDYKATVEKVLSLLFELKFPKNSN